MMIYGDFGVGKTYLAGTASDVEDMRDVLVISAESGDQTLDLDGDEDEHRFSDIDTIQLKSFSAVAKIYDYLTIHCKFRDEGDLESLAKMESNLKGRTIKPEDAKQYRTVIIDSLSELGSYCMNLLQSSETSRIDDEVEKPGYDEYGKSLGMMTRLVRYHRDLPMHVLFICGRTFEQDDLKRMHYMPTLTGQFRNKAQGFMDVVGYLQAGRPLEDGTIPRRLSVQPAGKFAAKCRFSRFKGTGFDDPTMKSILEAVGLAKD